MKYKIINLEKFITTILAILVVIIAISIIFSKQSLSHGEQKYKTVEVTNGDTLWSIAAIEVDTNSYYQDKDVRDVIDQIKDLNNLKSSSLSVGQELLVYEN